MARRWMGLMLVLASFLAWGLSGCTATPAAPMTAAPAVPTVAVTLAADVSVEEVHAVYQQPGVTIVDVREVDEYKAGHIPGALLIPLSELEQRVKDVPRDTQVILVCRSGNRSAQAYAYLRQQGFANVHNMLGGMRAWTAAGYPVEP